MSKSIKEEFQDEVRKEFQKDWEKEKAKNPDCDPDSWWEERRLGMKIFLGSLMGIAAIGLFFLFGWIVMLLWNWLMPEIFNLPEITYWQAWGLLALSSILFKSFPSGGDSSSKKTDKKRRRKIQSLMDENVIRPEEDESEDKEKETSE